jgi:predicted Zn-dependent protease
MLSWSVLAAGCATTSPLLRQQCDNADAQLAKVVQPLEALRAKGCSGGVVERGASECDRLRLELERLVLVCPAHAPTLMANAVVAYDERQPIKAQQYLDQILSQTRSYPDAAVLRGRIAIEEGNLPFARRLLEQQLKLVPDHAGLHETFGAALYLDGQLDNAARELTSAAGLGAPAWRIAYHLGLVDEAAGRFDEAAKRYAEALAGNPGWAPAQSRANALRARSGARP